MYVSVQARPRKKYGIVRGLIDFTLVVLTGGLWLIWMLVRYLRNNSR